MIGAGDESQLPGLRGGVGNLFQLRSRRELVSISTQEKLGNVTAGE
jgi:hypothetical protein